MPNDPDALRHELLAHVKTDSPKFESYRNEVNIMLANNERALKRHQWYAGSIWVFTCLIGTLFFVLIGFRGETPVGAWIGTFACFMLISAAVELIKYFINRNQTALLKELKGMELQILELKEELTRSRS